MPEELRREDVSLAIVSAVGRMEGALRFRGWQAAVASERWDRAFGRIRGLADLYEPTASPDLWKRLMMTGLVAGAHANARGELGVFVRQTGRHAAAPTLPELAPVMNLCVGHERNALGKELGAALIRIWPDSPAGWFVRGDAAERRGTVRNWRPRSDWADDFRHAWERRDSLDSTWQQTVALRYVVAALRAGGTHSEVRAALKEIRRNELSDSQRGWLAYGLAHSRHWLDQIKAVDVVDQRLDVAERTASAPDSHTIEIVETLVERLDPSPHEPVLERLESLLTHRSLATVDTDRWWRALKVRRELHSSIDEPLLAATDLTGSASLLAQAHRGVVPVDDGLIAHLARTIDAPTVERLDALRRDLVRYPDEAWRPLAVLWPRLMKEGSAFGSDDESIVEAIDRIGRAWSERAPRPSYGWWNLAENFVSVGAWEAARAAAWRGLVEEKENDADGARDVVLGKVITRLVRDADVDTLRAWLERAQPD